MCGIAGVLELDPHARVESWIPAAMCDAIRRRGPDDAGYYVEGPVALGMRRLSIIDVSGGHQPIANEDGSLTIVFNGEIFNHHELRAGLVQRGHRFSTRSDTETILHLFEEEGPKCLRHLRGMFAIAIWNAREQSLFVARDRLGIKPLYYAFDGRRFVFGSEIKAVSQHPSVPRRINWTALDAYFTYGFVPAPWTIYEDIQRLPAAHYVVVDRNGLRQEAYWDLEFEPKLTGSADDLAAEFQERFRECVEMRMESEVPLGAFLSGGVDSSLVVAMMAGASSQPVETFTIGFGGDVGTFLDERPFAREVSARYGTRHHEFEVRPNVEEALDVALEAFDEPFADDSLIPTHHVCRLSKQHVTVVLTGLGGDENFAGYERYLGFRLSMLGDSRASRPLLGLARPLVAALRESRGGHYRVNHLKRFMAASALPLPTRWQRYQAILPQDDRRRLYVPEVSRAIDFDAVDRLGSLYFERAQADDPLDRALYQDLKFYLPDDILALTDRVGMWHSLELRVPFVDHTLVEFCARIPSSLKVRLPSGEKKHLLRKVARPLLPDSVLDHRKQGFAAPIAKWVRGPMQATVDRALSPAALDAAGVLVPAEIERRVDDHRTRRSLNDKHIFSVLMFQRWWQRQETASAVAVGAEAAAR